MNLQKYVAVAHRDHDYRNPLSSAKIERMLDLLPLDQSSRVLDLGCGRAELALRIIERFGSTVIAIDHSSYMLDAARERAEWTGALGRLHLDDTDIRDLYLAAEPAPDRRFAVAPGRLRHTHVATLVRALRPDADADLLAHTLLSSVDVVLVDHLVRDHRMPLARIEAGWHDLVDRLTRG